MKQSVSTAVLLSLCIGLLSIPFAFPANSTPSAPGVVMQGSPTGIQPARSPRLVQPNLMQHNPIPRIASPTSTPTGYNPSRIVTHPYPGWRTPVPTPRWHHPRPWWRPVPGTWRHPGPWWRPGPWRPGPGWYWGHHFYWEFRFWPRPPVPWYWAPPPPRLASWWFWIWWRPLPISVQYYYPAPVVYPNDYSYYAYPDTEPVPAEIPEYYAEPQSTYPNAESQIPSNVPQIKSQEDYENWLTKTLNLTKTQEKPFIQKFRNLAELREKFIEKSASLGNEVAALQKTDPTSSELMTKQEKLQNTEFEFRKKEQKLMNDLMAILTLQQREAFMNQIQQYTPESTYNEDYPTD